MHLGLQSPDTNPSKEFISNMGPTHKELSLSVNATSLLLEKNPTVHVCPSAVHITTSMLWGETGNAEVGPCLCWCIWAAHIDSFSLLCSKIRKMNQKMSATLISVLKVIHCVFSRTKFGHQPGLQFPWYSTLTWVSLSHLSPTHHERKGETPGLTVHTRSDLRENQDWALTWTRQNKTTGGEVCSVWCQTHYHLIRLSLPRWRLRLQHRNPCKPTRRKEKIETIMLWDLGYTLTHCRRGRKTWFIVEILLKELKFQRTFRRYEQSVRLRLDRAQSSFWENVHGLTWSRGSYWGSLQKSLFHPIWGLKD